MKVSAIIDAYRHMNIRNKLSLLLTSVVLVSLAFTIAVQRYAFSLYDGQIYEKSSRVLNLSSTAIETELNRLEQLSYNLVADAQIQKWLTSLKDNPSGYDTLLVRQQLTDRLFSYSGSESYVYSIQIFDAGGGEHAGGNIRPFSLGKFKEITRIANEAQGENRWIFPDSSDDALIAAREIRSFTNTQFDLRNLGTLVLRINLKRIAHDLASGEGDLMIVSEDGVIYADKPTPNLENLPLSTGKQRGYVITELGGEQYFVAYRRSPDSGWTYLNLTPFRQIFEQILFIKELVVFVFVGIFLVVIVLVLRFSRNITHPIYDLIGRMKLAEKGNFEEANFAPAGEGPVVMNEIGLLQRTFRLMIERINRLIKENYSNRLLIKETEFKALQAQINPHFLYNTLESINWMAKVNKQDRISTMVEALAFLLRQSVDMKRPMITLEEELDIVRSYVTIQTIRFEERLDFRLDVPERFFRLALPKLTLQPLLENAIHYALEPTIEPCRITIRAWETDSDIRLAVEDTGPGIPAGTLERLKSGELPTKGKGIGLLNIDERIKIAFGEEYGIRLENTEGGGARVILALPRDKEE